MRKLLFELGAALSVILLIFPVCLFASAVAFIEAFKLFPEKIYELFEFWYREL